MKTKLLLFTVLTLLFFPAYCVATPLITGVLYDPAGTDTGNEWIELYNPSNQTLDLSRISIEKGDGAKEHAWTPIALNMTGNWSSNTFYLVAEQQVPYADIVTKLVLGNGPDSVRLLYNNSVVSTVGYGNLSFEDYFEGLPTIDVTSKALIRNSTMTNTNYFFSQTRNNSFDFYGANVSPRNQLQSSSQGVIQNVTVTIRVVNNPPLFSQVIIAQNASDISLVNGWQLPIVANVTDADGVDDVTSLEIRIYDNTTLMQSVFYTNTSRMLLSLNFVPLPKKYLFVAIAADSHNESAVYQTIITFAPVIGVQIHANQDDLEKSNGYYTGSVTVQNTGNVPISLISQVIAPSFESFEFYSNHQWISALEAISLDDSVGVNMSKTVAIRAKIPLQTQRGNYSANIRFFAMP
jgi:hypothetical protein